MFFKDSVYQEIVTIATVLEECAGPHVGFNAAHNPQYIVWATELREFVPSTFYPTSLWKMRVLEKIKMQRKRAAAYLDKWPDALDRDTVTRYLAVLNDCNPTFV